MEFDDTQPKSIQFGTFELRPQSGELLCEGTSINLPPQPFKVLLLLVRNAGQLISRKELQLEIWGQNTFVDFDKGLNLCIAQIREALGDDSQSPKYIETLPRRGYRFIAQVETAPTQADEPALRNEGSASSDGLNHGVHQFRFGGSSGLLLTLFAVVVVAAASILYFRTIAGTPSHSTRPARSTLLVLPFENLSGDSEQEYFSDGLTEEMITRLGSLQPKRLAVIARTTALTYKKTGKDIRQIGEELGANYVLEGTVRREDGRLRITSKLIQADNQTQLWSESFDRDESDLLNIQQEVASRIASSLRLELLTTSDGVVSSNGSANPKAYDAYLKGRFLVAKDTLEDLKRSIPFFDQAILEDPNFAPAYSAEVEALVLLTDWTGSAANIDLSKAKAAALKAIDLNPDDSEGYAALGSVEFLLDWNRGEAGLNFRRAVELNPNNPLTRLNYGRLLISTGQIEAGLGEIDEALRSDPVSLLTTGLAAFAHLSVGRYQRAVVLSNRMLELEPKSWAAHECLFRAYVGMGDYSKAVSIMRKQVEIWGDKPNEPELFDKGDPEKTVTDYFRQNLRGLDLSASKGRPVWTLQAAWYSARLGEKDKAFEWLEKALKERASFLLYLTVDPMWDPIRSDPRFESISARVVL